MDAGGSRGVDPAGRSTRPGKMDTEAYASVLQQGEKPTEKKTLLCCMQLL